MADPWWHDAACRGLDPELFFPRRGQTDKEAKAVCVTCPVQAQCLADYMTWWSAAPHAGTHDVGVVGNTNATDRQRQRQRHHQCECGCGEICSSFNGVPNHFKVGHHLRRGA